MTRDEVDPEDRGVGRAVDNAHDGVDSPELAEAMAGFARENPHVALAAAAGLGFLLGGGMTPRMLGTLVSLATRGYLRGTVTRVLQDVLTGQLQSQRRTG